MQNDVTAQDTEVSSLFGWLVGVGTAVAVQWPPDSTAAIALVGFVEEDAPTATQLVGEAHDTLSSTCV